MKTLSHAVLRRWYGRAGALRLLSPLSVVFERVAAHRRRRAQPWRAPVPVLVVGNIAVGGTGKTPVVAAIAHQLRQWGYRPGIVSRGYGGDGTAPRVVTLASDPSLVGDEPVLLAQLIGCPVWVGRDRPAAVRALLAAHACDVVIADDGLQHYALGRDFEIAVVDGQRGLGNGALLPVGPLREPAQRLTEVDWVLINGGDWQYPRGLRFELVPDQWHALAPVHNQQLPAGTVHAVAGIGHPERFFQTLSQQGLTVIPHAFPDHHPYRPEDLVFGDSRPVVTTAKDAVKLARLQPLPAAGVWYLAVRAVLPEPFWQELREALTRSQHTV